MFYRLVGWSKCFQQFIWISSKRQNCEQPTTPKIFLRVREIIMLHAFLASVVGLNFQHIHLGLSQMLQNCEPFTTLSFNLCIFLAKFINIIHRQHHLYYSCFFGPCVNCRLSFEFLSLFFTQKLQNRERQNIFIIIVKNTFSCFFDHCVAAEFFILLSSTQRSINYEKLLQILHRMCFL